MATVAEFRNGITSTVPPELSGLDRATPQELAFLAMVRKHLAAARVSRMDGELTFKASMKVGGVESKKAIIEVREK